jgi:hypothetical protein
LEENAERIHAQGLGLAAISYDSTEVLKQFAARAHITFPLLSDADSAVIRRYAILNETVAKGTPQYGIPYPGTYVLDARGVVTGKFFDDDFRVRDTPASMLLRQFGMLPTARQSLDAKHLKLSASASDEAVRPGQRITLAVDIDLPSRVHVYAPGVAGYIPTALSLAKTQAFQADAAVFPPSKSMTLAVIHETVPVYEGRFRVMETITIGNAQDLQPLLDAGRNLTIEGAFRYQACDDRECFVPETVPLRWTVKVEPFDRTRVPAEIQKKGGDR